MRTLISRYKNWKLRRQFLKFYWKRINWTEREALSHTRFCGSLPDAINHLSYKLLGMFLCDDKEERILFRTSKELITKRYQDGWVRIN